MSPFEPRILAFLCRWCSYRGADAAGRQRRTVPWQVRPVQVPCAGRVAPEQVMEALHEGADGVLVLACHPGDCHHRYGNRQAGQRLALLQALLNQAGVAPERIGFDYVAAGEGERFASLAREFTDRVRGLGPLEVGDG